MENPRGPNIQAEAPMQQDPARFDTSMSKMIGRDILDSGGGFGDAIRQQARNRFAQEMGVLRANISQGQRKQALSNTTQSLDMMTQRKALDAEEARLERERKAARKRARAGVVGSVTGIIGGVVGGIS